MSNFSPPSSILIIGSGVFGLSTAYALSQRRGFEGTAITVVDRAPDPERFPSSDASSVDTSRIIRADYADAAYAALAAEAQAQWRQQGPDDLGGQGRYTESGLILVADAGDEGASSKTFSSSSSSSTSRAAPQNKMKTGMDYVKASWENVAAMAATDPELHDSVRVLADRDAIRSALGTGGGSGSWGYLNRLSGWADAEASMHWLLDRVRRTGRVRFVSGTVASLLYCDGGVDDDGRSVRGVRLLGGDDGRELTADLTVVAAGAWSGTLVAGLAGRAVATGQVLGYVDITAEEQARLAAMPVILNLTTGLFAIPPAHGVFKVARHAYGYLNPTRTTTMTTTEKETAIVSTPVTHLAQEPGTCSATSIIPAEGAAALRTALREMAPLPTGLAERPFARTRLCWYSDTPTGDFLIDYHPGYGSTLFVATGDSGHGFKFLPVIGERIVDCIAGDRPPEFSEKWAWNESALPWDAVVTEDGSRGGKPGLILRDEMGKTSPST